MARTPVTDQNSDGHGIVEEDFSVIMAQAFATYGLSVVTDRALPDARDGLKPVQRRILAGMREARYFSTRSTVKSAEVVGLILGNYHPHGDSSVYEAAVRLAQSFTMRYPLIEGQGNMGSEDGDAPAAYRYTEMRLSPLAEAMMSDLPQETVPLHPTYKQDPKVLEPDYLPGHIPPVVNPSSGIAVGLSTNIPPHNMGEVLRACIALLDKPEMTLEQLMGYIQGPDFPQGGCIVGDAGIKDYFRTGKGRIYARAEVRLEETPRNRSLVVTQIPPIGRDKLKNSIVKAINARKLEGLAPDVRDETDTEKGTRIVLELRKEADPAQVLTQLYKDTDLQVALSFQMVFLFGQPMQAARQPKQVGMLEVLNYWNEHQLDVLTRRLQFELRKARERLHVVEGLLIGSSNAQEIVKIFQNAEDRAAARQEIEQRYDLTTIQSDVIASMTLAQVTRMDAGKYVKEQADLSARIDELLHHLSERKTLIVLLKKEMQQLLKQFGDERRTKIIPDGLPLAPVEAVESLYKREPFVVAFTRSGAWKALPADAFKAKAKQEGKYLPVRGDEQLRQIIATTTQDYLLAVTSNGHVFQIASHRIPGGTRATRGEPVGKLLALETGEEIVTFFPLAEQEEDSYLVTFSRLGKVKKTPLSEYRAVDVDGMPDMKLAEGDSVVAAVISRGQGEYLVTATNGQTLRFSDEVLRSQGRVGQGVAAIGLTKEAVVVSAIYLDQSDLAAQKTLEQPLSLLIVTEQGVFKRLLLNEIPARGRATSGVSVIELVANDQIYTTALAKREDTYLCSWSNGHEQVIVVPASEIKLFPRVHQGQQIATGRINSLVKL